MRCSPAILGPHERALLLGQCHKRPHKRPSLLLPSACACCHYNACSPPQHLQRVPCHYTSVKSLALPTRCTHRRYTLLLYSSSHLEHLQYMAMAIVSRYLLSQHAAAIFSTLACKSQSPPQVNPAARWNSSMAPLTLFWRLLSSTLHTGFLSSTIGNKTKWTHNHE